MGRTSTPHSKSKRGVQGGNSQSVLTSISDRGGRPMVCASAIAEDYEMLEFSNSFVVMAG